jgi:hypothetical protein
MKALDQLDERERAKLDELYCFSWRSNSNDPKPCLRYMERAEALDMPTRRALCEYGSCEPLLEALEALPTAANRAERLVIALRVCKANRETAAGACATLQAELTRADDAAVMAQLVGQCERWSARAGDDYGGRSNLCRVAIEVFKARGRDAKAQRRYDQMLLRMCKDYVFTDSCSMWLARQAPDATAPLNDKTFGALRDACVSGGRKPPCEALWRAWQGQRVPQLTLGEGRSVGALACLKSGDAALCEEIVQSRLVGTPDNGSLEYAAALRISQCRHYSGESCGALSKMHAQGQLTGAARELFIEINWSSCSRAEKPSEACTLYEALTR